MLDVRLHRTQARMSNLPGQPELVSHIADRLRALQGGLAQQWQASGPVRHVYIDDFLPEPWARAIAGVMPPMSQLRRYDSLKERKGIGIDFDAYPPILKDITFAFQAPSVLAAAAAFSGITRLNPDEHLYSGGLSAMGEGDYLNPHIDNSGNPFLQQYRRINVLLYVTPGWNSDWGGNLELWDAHRANPIRLEPRFNRVIFMNTNRTSFHSVNPIHGCGALTRNCVSNYYFSPDSPEGYEYSHVTSFRGRPEQALRDLWLRFDAWGRGMYRRFRPRRAGSIRHRYG
jgi:Rps23 Pro-64 3,4-dihydroxylase Tpa1-like proline 4-hydroxylase